MANKKNKLVPAPIKKYVYGKRLLNDKSFKNSIEKEALESKKEGTRTEIINFLLSTFTGDTNYLEIGVRNPNDNFNHINATKKYSVDPGVEFKENPVDFKLTSDEFFAKLDNGEILNRELKFHVIFIDGLHLAEQVDRDIKNALKNIKDKGFIVLHDCNPPTEWHARENYSYHLTPARQNWNGTTWKAFLKWRYDKDLSSCCIDTDWGVGIISKTNNLGDNPTLKNEFYEFNFLDKNRKELLNLISFTELKNKLK